MAAKQSGSRKRSRPVEPKKVKLEPKIIGLIAIIAIVILASAAFPLWHI